ncbi:MAG: DNA gyrase subunit A [Candidatus Cloacimonetes bacterium]|nr:DNA gyrase subunit A [Candidatus Cloacimonadota bacterium]
MEKTNYGTIKPTSITDEMRRSYLDYAMSVIVARAIPDAKDGLKPVHRRVLYAMHKLGLSHTSSYKKCARIVGEVIGKYHPHGDAAAYETLVRMGQDFSLRYPLVDGQGNFGSIDGDSPAAMRYTEARLTKIADEMLHDLDKETVDFIDNFDGSEQEPQTLPAKPPNLLLNGGDGIAVGMATRIPPHNLGEIIDALVFIIENAKVKQLDGETVRQLKSTNLSAQADRQTDQPSNRFEIESDTTIEQLTQFVHGPDFPTGAIIYGQKDILQAYETGRGSILMRAKTEIVEKKAGRSASSAGKFQIAVLELPYQQNKALLVAKIAELVNDGKIKDIADLRDESDRSGLKIAIDLKSGATPQRVLNLLFKYTPMQQAYHINMVALVNNEPKTLNLKQALLEYLSHRQVVVVRRINFELKKARQREHILQGLKIALSNLDAVIETIKKSKDSEVARTNLVKKFSLTEIQAQAILDMQLKRLAALERQKILDELAEITALIEKLTSILASPKKIMKVIKDELIELKEKYGDERRTKVVKGKPGEFAEEELTKNEPVIVTLTRGGYIKRVPITTYRTQGRGGKGVTGGKLKEEDVVAEVLTTMTHDEILFFTNKGRVFSSRVYDIPEAGRTARGQALVNLIGLEANERVLSVLPMKAGGE